jgi:ABC-type phosphate/phosphonate transport system substrate-binding protein
MPAAVYQLAAARCDAQAELVSQRFGVGWEASMLIVRTDGNVFTRDGLTGLRWAVDSQDSLANDLYFQALFAAEGIEVGEIIETGSDSSSILALLNGEADFATASFLPPLLPRLEREWEYGVDSPEIWRQLGIPPTRHPRGFIIVLALAEDGGYRIRDARAAVFDVRPDVFNITRINELSGRLPNDVAAFGADMPLGTARAISSFLLEHAAGDACLETVCSGDFLNWTGFEPINAATFAALDFMTETLELSPETILGLYDQ